MTILWSPYKHRHDGRPYENRIGRPYYGHRLRRVLSEPEPRPSVIESASLLWERLSESQAFWAGVCVGAVAVLSAAFVVVVSS